MLPFYLKTSDFQGFPLRDLPICSPSCIQYIGKDSKYPFHTTIKLLIIQSILPIKHSHLLFVFSTSGKSTTSFGLQPLIKWFLFAPVPTAPFHPFLRQKIRWKAAFNPLPVQFAADSSIAKVCHFTSSPLSLSSPQFPTLCSSHCFRLCGEPLCAYSFYAKNKVYDMAKPHNGKDHARYINFLPQHHGKTNPH